MIEQFLKSVVVVDTEFTSLNSDEADIIELGVSTYDAEKQGWDITSELYSPRLPIPFESSDINNISRRRVEGLPTFVERVESAKDMIKWNADVYYVAHNVTYERTILKSNLKRAGQDVSKFTNDTKDNWFMSCILVPFVIVRIRS